MSMHRVTLLTNILPPYRIGFLNELARLVDLTVIVNSLTTPDRLWQVDTSSLRFDLQVEAGISIRFQRTGASKIAETRYLQIGNRTLPILHRTAPAVVVSSELGLRTAQAELYARWRRVPFICHWEGTAHTEASISSARRQWRRALVRGIDAAWVNGVESRDYLASLGVRPETMTLAMTGVDTKYFRTEAARWRASREERRRAMGLKGLVFGYSGRLSGSKGVSQYLQALTLLARRASGTTFSLLFIGDGEQRPLIEAWGATHPDVGLHLAGFQQLARLPEYYVCADWFVLPTLDDCWALATVEPIACGVPQVYSKYNGASADLICAAGSGVLADPLNVEHFSDVLFQVLRKGPRHLAPEVVDSVVEKYSSEAQAQRAADCIADALARPRA